MKIPLSLRIKAAVRSKATAIPARPQPSRLRPANDSKSKFDAMFQQGAQS